MPYTAYSGITDDDIKALYAYFTKGVDAVDVPAERTALPFPFSIRASMIGWNLLFLNDKPFTPTASKDAEWNRGAYLAQTLAHCSTCHTPRNLVMAEKTGKAFSGASLGTWYAPNITSDKLHGIGNWSADQLQSYLSKGHSGTGSEAGGPMLEAIDKSLSKLSPPDVKALAIYISALPSQAGMAAPGQTSKASLVEDDIALMSGTAPDGEKLYDAHCSTCHAASGAGGNGLPALLGNAAVRRPTADNVAMTIIGGLEPSEGQTMPAFGDRLDDQQVASLANFLFKQFGDAGVQITKERVAELRAGGAPSSLVQLAQTGIYIALAVIVILVLGLIIWFSRRRRAAA
jgi:mono/diheme cytochrome c family protein